jgi:hypothetical protein
MNIFSSVRGQNCSIFYAQFIGGIEFLIESDIMYVRVRKYRNLVENSNFSTKLNSVCGRTYITAHSIRKLMPPMNWA